jgi:uncharacterized protein DUF2183
VTNSGQHCAEAENTMKRRPKDATAAGCLLLLLTVVPSIASADDAFIIISDVDDTVKVTDVLHPGNAFQAALASKLVFAGMPELYQELLGPNSSSDRLIFISGSSDKLDKNVDRMLENARFPAYKLVLRRPREMPKPVFDYKLSRLNTMYGSSKAQFLLIGDDTEKDPEVYVKFSKSPRNRIYIHRVKGRNSLSSCIPFVTAYDIAVHEFLLGHMNEQQTAAVGIAVLTSIDRSVLPNFQKCPSQFEHVAGLPDSLAKINEYIRKRITNICASRRKD